MSRLSVIVWNCLDMFPALLAVGALPDCGRAYCSAIVWSVICSVARVGRPEARHHVAFRKGETAGSGLRLRPEIEERQFDEINQLTLVQNGRGYLF